MSSIATSSGTFYSILTHGGTYDPRVFGGIYTAFTSFDSFSDFARAMGLTHIRWPGGTMAEQDRHRYSLSHSEVFNPSLDRPGLSDMLAFCNANGTSFSMTIPTSHYVGLGGAIRSTALRSEVREFAIRLVRGDFGDVPDDMTLDIGNEYYAQPEFQGKPLLFARIANMIIEELVSVFDNPSINRSGVDIGIAMQIGATLEEDAIIRSAMSSETILAIDELRTHRLSGNFNNAGRMIDRVEESLLLWRHEQRDAGGTGEFELNMSAWSTANWTRPEAIKDYIKHYRENFGTSISVTSVENAQRSDTGFERFWQTGELVGPSGQIVRTTLGLTAFDYGPRTALNYLEMMSKYVEIGLDRASVYGIDVAGATTGSRPNALRGHLFGTEMFAMMAESLPGMTKMNLPGEIKRPAGISNHVNVYSFESSEKIVVFLAANNINNSTGLTYDFSNLQLDGNIVAAWGERLYGRTPSNWMDLWRIPDNPYVNESPEAVRYSMGISESFLPNFIGDTVRVSFRHDYEVIRLVLAKPTADLASIEGWAGRNRYDFFPITESASAVHSAAGTALSESLIGTFRRDHISGLAGNDTLVGGLGGDTILGGAGNDHLNGGAGSDLMVGGEGDDTYFVDNPFDQTVEEPMEGIDWVFSGVGYSLTRNVENLQLAGVKNLQATGNDQGNIILGNVGNNKIAGLAGNDTLYANEGDDTILGGSGNDQMRGGAGNDLLDGGVGTDHMSGERGNDTYIVDAVGDTVLEGPGSGYDIVISFVSYSLPRNVEVLQMAGEAHISGGGGVGADSIAGNSGNNRIMGEAGNDTLSGNQGDDFLDGGIGVDHLIGGEGNDFYLADNARDVIVERMGEGRDTVQSSVSWVLGRDLEDLVLIGSTAIEGTGNRLANVIFGNAADNVLHGWGGNDRLTGGAGRDRLFGGDGADFLIGGGGDDVLMGGLGADTFVFERGFGNDVIRDFDPSVRGEKIDLSGLSQTLRFADIRAAMTQIGNSTQIDIEDQSILIFGVNMGDMSHDDFIF